MLPSKTSQAERIAIAWSGMRGGVSLAAALAITHEGFPDRDLVIFVAYAVIVLTLVLPGSRSRRCVRRLGLVESEEHRREAAEARLRITQAALERLDELGRRRARARRAADARPLRLARRAPRGAHARATTTRTARPTSPHAGRLLAEMIDAERDVLKAMRTERAFDAEIAEGDRARARPR